MGITKTLTNWSRLYGSAGRRSRHEDHFIAADFLPVNIESDSRQRPIQDAFWGPVSASINWCEADYEVSRHIAEFINTLSNLPFLFMAIFGIKSSIDNDIPADLWLPFVGIAMVGAGSFLFHMTLSYRMQLLDELPMLFAVTFTTYCVWNTHRKGEPQIIPYIGILLFSLVTGVIVAYLHYPDPVLHQSAFALILTSAVARATYLCYTNLLETPFERARNKEFVRMQLKGVVFFVSAFGIWLVDCFVCDVLTDAKAFLGKPLAFLLELHAWWHIGTGLGSYYLATSLQLLVLSLREDPRDVEVEYILGGMLPRIKRVKPLRQLNGGASSLNGKRANGSTVSNGKTKGL